MSRTRVAPRDRRLINLQTREAKLIAAVKKAGQLGHRARYNALRMDLVKVRELVRRAGGEPVPRPLADVAAPQAPQRGPAPQRPERQPVRPMPRPAPGQRPRPDRRQEADESDELPEEEEAEEFEEEGTEGWDEDPMDQLVNGIRAEGGRIVELRGNTVVARAAGPITDGGMQVKRAIEQHLHVRAAVRQLTANTLRITLQLPQDFGDDDAAPKKKVNIFDAIRKGAQGIGKKKGAEGQARAGRAGKSNVLDKLKALVKGKGPHTTTKLGQHMAINVRAGYRAAIHEVRPGLFVVAEIPTAAVRQDFGDEIGIFPILFAPMIAKAIAKGVAKKAARKQGQGEPRQLEANAPRQLEARPDREEEEDVATSETEGWRPFGLKGDEIPRWLDSDIAGEFGCDACGNRCGRP